MADLYRKSALEKISNPEQLDKALIVTSPLSWLALLAITLIVAVTIVWAFCSEIPETLTLNGYAVSGQGNVGVMYADKAGTIHTKASPGDRLYPDEGVATIRQRSGEETDVMPLVNGVVTRLMVDDSKDVSLGQPILYFAPTAGNETPLEQMMVCYVPAKGGSDMSGQLARGNKVHLTPAGENNQSSGYIKGRVLHVEPYASTQEHALAALGDDRWSDITSASTVVKKVIILPEIRQDPTTGNNPYVWSNPKGEKLQVNMGDSFVVRIEVKTVRPIEKLFAKIGEVLGW